MNPFDFEEAQPERGETYTAPGIYYNMAHDEYHRSPGVNKSKLDLVAEDPSAVEWIKTAPVDSTKMDALEQGTFVHCLLGEPGEIDKLFVRAPELNLRTNDGKAALAEFKAENQHKTIISNDDWLKLHMMRDSALAHPVVKMIMETEGTNETAIFWNDTETGELCKIKPDRLIWLNGLPVIIDWKTIQGLDLFPKEVIHRRYHVQEAMYREGVKQHFGLKELPEFWFVPISKTINCGRYPVRVNDLPEDMHNDGYNLFRRDLQRFHDCRKDNDWLHINTITRPRWA